MDIIRDLPTIARWVCHPRFAQEVINTKQELNSLIPKKDNNFAGLESLIQKFGASLNFVVDPDDVLCPPDDLRDWLAQVKTRLPDDPDWQPQIIEDPNGHSPGYSRPRRFAILIHKISTFARTVRSKAKAPIMVGANLGKKYGEEV